MILQINTPSEPQQPLKEASSRLCRTYVEFHLAELRCYLWRNHSILLLILYAYPVLVNDVSAAVRAESPVREVDPVPVIEAHKASSLLKDLQRVISDHDDDGHSSGERLIQHALLFAKGLPSKIPLVLQFAYFSFSLGSSRFSLTPDSDPLEGHRKISNTSSKGSFHSLFRL